jgi:hypothetical protein
MLNRLVIVSTGKKPASSSTALVRKNLKESEIRGNYGI